MKNEKSKFGIWNFKKRKLKNQKLEFHIYQKGELKNEKSKIVKQN